MRLGFRASACNAHALRSAPKPRLLSPVPSPNRLRARRSSSYRASRLLRKRRRLLTCPRLRPSHSPRRRIRPRPSKGSRASPIQSTARERFSEASDDEFEVLADRLYDHIRTRFRSELLIDRERAGLLADRY